MSIEIITEATPELEKAFALLIPQLSTSSTPMTLEQLRELLAQDSLTLLAFRPDEPNADGERPILGMLSLVIFHIPTGWRAWIEDVVVDDAARGQGAGKALVDAATHIAQEKGVKSVDLTSRPSREAANRLYQRAGFAQRETNVYRFQN
ncbi:MAG: GNAT family N-acetyltransferase [Actinomycetaceae bacterium]|nr:GNAT family N-acetyltransferase [Arcanobacterium sp.]MDD7686900.1 GNAT family N-acetyltransferase [Actinomycetaceae bacterium]MDY5273448.1 GNAT family N-acetyltransferase [Arcanobacterium sp.]